MKLFLKLVCLLCFAFLGPLLPASGDARAEDQLMVFSASSLTDVVSLLASKFETQSGHTTAVSFAATSVLARQIDDGAPAHVFISANSTWMEALITSGAITANSVRTIAGNRLALVATEGVSYPMLQEGELSSFYNIASIAPGQPIAIGNPEHVPVGMYAREALSQMDFWNDLERRLVPMPNARSVVTSVIRGEVALGVIYASDQQLSPSMKLIGLFPRDSHTPIGYPAGLVQDNPHSMAESFLRFLVSSDAENVFKSLGFLPPPS